MYETQAAEATPFISGNARGLRPRASGDEDRVIEGATQGVREAIGRTSGLIERTRDLADRLFGSRPTAAVGKDNVPRAAGEVAELQEAIHALHTSLSVLEEEVGRLTPAL